MISHHETVNAMYERIRAAGLTNVADRFAEQEKVRCKQFCVRGLSCQLCSNGPCRVVPGKVERGSCGIDGAAMVMRNMVHRAKFGAAAYTYHCKEAARTLKATAAGKTPYRIKDEAKLHRFADELGIPAGGASERAAAVADAVLASLHEGTDRPGTFVEKYAPESRKKVWRELGILPGGPLHELLETTTRTMTSIDGHYVTLAKAGLRLGLATVYGALVPLEIIQDILFGTPQPHEAEVDLGILDPDYVNILPHGHKPFVGAALIEVARRPEVQEMARAAGAKGVRIIGSIETGQELMQRFPADDVFRGLTGNWITQEYALATGAVDLLAMDMNCSLPSLGLYAEKYGVTLVPVSPLVNLPGTADHLDYEPEKVEEQARRLVEMAVDNFRRRKGREAVRGLRSIRVLTGFSTEAVVQALGGSLDPLLEVIKKGTIKGVVVLVSCTSLGNGPQDALNVGVARELIRRDLLVLSAGCGNAACQVAGLTTREAAEEAGPGLKAVCRQLGVPPVLSFGTCADTGRLILLATAVAGALGIDPSQLPAAVTAPEYLEQKAVVDAFGAVAFGLYTHVSPTPPVTGSPEVVKLLTEDVEQLTGGKLAVGDDPVAVAEGIAAHIDKKRAALGI